MDSVKNNFEALIDSRQSPAMDALFDLNYSLYVTENYAANYAYPLIAYLHEGYCSDKDLWKWFPHISDQNYIGLGVRGPFPHPQGFPGKFDWKLSRPDASVAAIRDAVLSVQREWLIHPKRTYLFGEGTGAIVGLQHLILQQSLAYDTVTATGVICRSLPEGWWDWLPHISDELSGRILLLDPIHNPQERAAIDAISEAGIEITFSHPASDQPPTKVINDWIMSGINTAIF